MPLTTDEYEAAKRDPKFFTKRSEGRCARGEHTPMRAHQDGAVICTVCGAFLGHSNN